MKDSLPTISFNEYVFHNSRNKKILLAAAVAILVQLTVFKYLYPFASFLHNDSFVYLETAYFNLDINSYMVGYSRFLRLFSAFTSSDTVLVVFQYLLVQTSALFFLFTLFYFYKPGKVVQMVLLCFLVLNPLFLYMANLVTSDCFFLSLSLIWFSLLLWTIHRPSTKIIIWHILVLFIAFTVRYNALIYPFVTALAFLLSGLPMRKKMTGIAGGVVLCGLFVLYTGNKYKALTATWQYAPFSGWQLANNAMYAYRYVDSADRKPVPEKFKVLDNSIRVYFDSTRDIGKHPIEALMASTFYMWRPELPLFKYLDLQFSKDSTSSDFKKWASMGPLYGDYGIFIIKQYPMYYFRYFLLPNAGKYYAPPGEYLETYNTEKNSVAPIAQEWFGYKSQNVTTRMSDLKIRTLDFYPVLSGIMNVVFLCGLLCFSMLHGFRSNTLFRKGIILTGLFWLFNAGFSIFSTAGALRFLAFPILLMCTFAILLIDWMWEMAMNEKTERLKILQAPHL